MLDCHLGFKIDAFKAQTTNCTHLLHFFVLTTWFRQTFFATETKKYPTIYNVDLGWFQIICSWDWAEGWRGIIQSVNGNKGKFWSHCQNFENISPQNLFVNLENHLNKLLLHWDGLNASVCSISRRKCRHEQPKENTEKRNFSHGRSL